MPRVLAASSLPCDTHPGLACPRSAAGAPAARGRPRENHAPAVWLGAVAALARSIAAAAACAGRHRRAAAASVARAARAIAAFVPVAGAAPACAVASAVLRAAAVGGVWLQRGVQCRQSVLWLVHRIRLPQGLHPRLGRQHADQGPAGLPVRGLPVDLRRHHHRADRRRLRRTDQVPRGAAVLGAVVHPQLHPDGAHRLGRWLPG
ncbi:hypothetical protein G6F24_015320 [Rhizopus arrhizus]|nr:hypothetical protein G6F24_015320 [Rhizopus arrhizus]